MMPSECVWDEQVHRLSGKALWLSSKVLNQMTRLTYKCHAWHFSLKFNTDINNQSLSPNEPEQSSLQYVRHLFEPIWICLIEPSWHWAARECFEGTRPSLSTASPMCLKLITFDLALVLFWKMLCPCPGNELHIGGPIHLRTERKGLGDSSGAHFQENSEHSSNKSLGGDLCLSL